MGIKTQSDDPDVGGAATAAAELVKNTLANLPKAEEFDYGGHEMHLGDYNVCVICTSAIAEAQQAAQALHDQADKVDDPLVKEHIELAAHLFDLDADAAIVRANFHNGEGSEAILDQLLGYEYDRKLHDQYQHDHSQAESS